jgi:hypothetical protein
MMCPDHGAVDHVGRAIPLYHLGECLEECVEHAHLHPAPIAPEHAAIDHQRPSLRSSFVHAA